MTKGQSKFQSGEAGIMIGRAIAFGGPDYSYLSRPFIPSPTNMWGPSYNLYLQELGKNIQHMFLNRSR